MERLRPAVVRGWIAARTRRARSNKEKRAPTEVVFVPRASPPLETKRNTNRVDACSSSQFTQRSSADQFLDRVIAVDEVLRTARRVLERGPLGVDAEAVVKRREDFAQVDRAVGG